jgi:assimilatory nitrate reductase catalytic subunit
MSLLPSREAPAALPGTRIEPEMRTGMLVGNPDRPTAQRASGPTVCACFGVACIRCTARFAHQRLTSVAKIGTILRAGTNCGSCIPELKAILSGNCMENASAS